jgi:hypothetical protein
LPGRDVGEEEDEEEDEAEGDAEGEGEGVGVAMARLRRPVSSGSADDEALGEDSALEVRCGPPLLLEHAQATTATTTRTATSTLIRRRQ